MNKTENILSPNETASSAIVDFYNDEKRFAWSFKTLKGFETPYDKRRLNVVVKTILNIRPRPKKILDLGCGSAIFTKELARRGFEIVGTDISKKILAKIDKEELDFELVLADSRSLPFKDNFFDLVFSTEVIEHIPNCEKTIAEISRVLKPNKIAVITVPNLFCLDALEAKWKFCTRLIKLINLFRKNPIYPHGYSSHLNKHDYQGWKKIIESFGLKVIKTLPVFLSPYVFEATPFLKKIEKRIYQCQPIYKFQSKTEEAIGKIWPFYLLGQSFLFVCKNEKN